MSKLIKFVKENKIIVIALSIVLLSFILFAIPGYVHVTKLSAVYKLSGYSFFFNTKYTVASALETKVASGVSKLGIAIFVLLIVAIPGLIFSKKSSFVMLLTGLEMLATSIMLFCTESSAAKTLPIPFKGEYLCGALPYIIAVLVLIAAGLVIYKTVMVMKNEVKHPVKKDEGPTYNYLKK